MKLGKKILTGAVILLVVIVILAVVIIMHLGAIVAEAARTFGTQAAGTKVAVKSVYVSLLSGDLQINKLTIDNPPGYKDKEAFGFDLVAVDLDVNSVFTDTVIVNKVKIDNVRIDFEPTLQGGSNLTDIKNNIMKFAQAEKTGAAQKPERREEKPEDTAPKKAKKVIIKSFVINKGRIMVSSSMLNTSVSVPLPRIELNDLGKESNMGEACAEIFDAIIKTTVEAVASANIEGLDIKKLKSKLLEDLPGTAEKIGKDIGKTIKDLF
ncbi:MAG: hypothetical protein PHV82_07250 [Victivallaceae bacterium]|nr:hypothetical protein [Victivallaceae bacterium]